MRLLVPCIPLLLAGCVETAPSTPAQSNDCGADGYQGLVGAQLAAVTLPAGLNARIIHPDTAVTLDYRTDRMNIDVDAQGRITAVFCG